MPYLFVLMLFLTSCTQPEIQKTNNLFYPHIKIKNTLDLDQLKYVILNLNNNIQKIPLGVEKTSYKYIIAKAKNNQLVLKRRTQKSENNLLYFYAQNYSNIKSEFFRILEYRIKNKILTLSIYYTIKTKEEKSIKIQQNNQYLNQYFQNQLYIINKTTSNQL
jgi:hypothetical protein